MSAVLAELDRRLYGGDMRMLQTLPEDGILPSTQERVYGTRSELGLVARQPRLTFYRGDVIYKPEPERRFAMDSWHDTSTGESKDDLFMALGKGWTFGKSEDWDFSERMVLLGWETDLDTGHWILPVVQKGLGIYPEKYHFIFCPWDVYQMQQQMMNADTNATLAEYQNNDQDTVTLLDENPMEEGGQRIKPSMRSVARQRLSLEDLPVETE